MAASKDAGGGKVVGFEEMRATLRRAEELVGKENLHAMKRLLVASEGRAKRRTPVEFGLLRASIWWKVRISGDKVLGRIGFSQGYGAYLEWPNKHLQQPAAGRTGAGTVGAPYTSWPALKRRGGTGQTIPYLRPAVLEAYRFEGSRLIGAGVKRARRAARGGRRA